MIKKIIIGLAIALPMVYFTAGSAAAAENNNFSTELDGTQLGTQAYSQEGTLYLPLRAVSEAMGYTVEWSAKDREVTLQRSDEKMIFDIDAFSVTDGNHQFYADEQVVNGTLYLSEDFYNDCLGLSTSPDQIAKKVTLVSVKENDITIKTINETTTDQSIDITLQYTQISGLADRTVQDKINALVKQEADAAKNEGLSYIKEFPDNPSGNKYQVYFDYRIKYDQDNLLSIVLMDYQFAGGAHGDTIQTSYTFDLKTGAEYGMKDLFTKDSSYTSLFNDLVKTEIKARELYELAPFESIAEDQAYYLENSGVTVYFEPYEYFPHAAGIQTFTANYDTLKDMLDPSLSFLYKSTAAPESVTQKELSVGEISTVTLKGNPTTGYSWQYTIEDSSIIKLDKESSVPDSAAMGAGSTFTWDFKALKAGETKIIFKYYRPWEGEATAEQTIEYTIKVN